MSCATPWPWIPWTVAASILARPAGRSTAPRRRVTAGIRSCGICRPCCPWRSRRWEADMIRVVLPYHLRNLAQVDREVQIEVAGPVTLRSVLDALEFRYPMLRGTIRDHTTLQRR